MSYNWNTQHCLHITRCAVQVYLRQHVGAVAARQHAGSNNKTDD